MEKKFFIKNVVKANFHKGGIKCLRLFKMNRDFFSLLRKEALILAAHNTPSDSGDPSVISRTGTRPYGNHYQYSLFNESGRYNDPSTDWNRSTENKRFHYEKKYPSLSSFINFFPGITNMNLLVLGPGSGLLPHEAHVMTKCNNKKSLILRFHLPLLTNPRAEMLLDNEYFRFEEQYVYFFNEGCIHSAYNRGTDYRYHLSWDMHLNDEVFEFMFPDKDANTVFMNSVEERERFVIPHRYEKTGAYKLQDRGGKLYKKLQLDKMGVKAELYNKFYNEISYLNFKFKEEEYYV
jgi:hypothetical protein